MSPIDPPEDVSPLMAVLLERWVLTLATVPRPISATATPGESAPDAAIAESDYPYATPLFYAVAEHLIATPTLVFASRPDSTHGRHLGAGPTRCAAGLYLESEDVSGLRGVQLRGEVALVERWPGDAPDGLRAAYLRRHPGAAALLRPGARERLYGLALTWAKLTDNRRGFGHKQAWNFSPSIFGAPFEDPPHRSV
ncbi:MAG: hypothetical protein H0T76_06530 [Nannocystis sp.]|nr:hypothetical protein [Nannocystis sp.]MBA3546118.1 hypothetical protein [Nannocystis sp.]